jgi:hypothetical protein
MTDGLFHIDADGHLVSMTATPYEAESILQALLETHPDLLAGGQMEPDSPRRWLLVKREQGVPDREDSASRWSVDHVFVDQDAVPTLVEVKRSTDTRIRREVVGQMLDYAANGVRYWPPSELRAAFEATQEALDANPEVQVQDLCNDSSLSLDDFFGRVEDNLRAGRIRMVFVADVIPDELMRITEFLNEQMNPAQVFAVEVKQYRAGDHHGTVIVPAVFGRTSAASIKTSHRNQQSRDELIEESHPETLELLAHLKDFAEAEGMLIRDTRSGSLLKAASGRTVACLYLANWNMLEVPLQPLRDRGFEDQANQALARLQAMTSKRLTQNAPNLPSADGTANWDELRNVLVGLSRVD